MFQYGQDKLEKCTRERVTLVCETIGVICAKKARRSEIVDGTCNENGIQGINLSMINEYVINKYLQVCDCIQHAHQPCRIRPSSRPLSFSYIMQQGFTIMLQSRHIQLSEERE